MIIAGGDRHGQAERQQHGGDAKPESAARLAHARDARRQALTMLLSLISIPEEKSDILMGLDGARRCCARRALRLRRGDCHNRVMEGD
jgi:hypothetical protein